MNIREQVRITMAEAVGQSPDRVEDSALLTDLVSSSFLLVETMIELQEEYAVRFQQEDLVDVKTVGGLLDLVVSRIATADIA